MYIFVWNFLLLFIIVKLNDYSTTPYNIKRIPIAIFQTFFTAGCKFYLAVDIPPYSHPEGNSFFFPLFSKGKIAKEVIASSDLSDPRQSRGMLKFYIDKNEMQRYILYPYPMVIDMGINLSCFGRLLFTYNIFIF